MKTTYAAVLALVALPSFFACSKKTDLPAETPIPAGEFYIKATINGQPYTMANGVNNISFSGNAGITIGRGSVNTSGSQFFDPLTTKSSVSLSLEEGLSGRITSLTGKRLPFMLESLSGAVYHKEGVLLDLVENNDWQMSWLAGNNHDSTRYYADIISVTPYNKGSYGRSGNREYFKVTLRFGCRLLAYNGEVDAANGEAVILVGRAR